MNPRIAISLSLSVILHGLLFWMLIISSPKTTNLPLNQKGHVLTVNLSQPTPSFESVSTASSESKLDESIFPVEISSDVENSASENMIAENNTANIPLNLPEPKYYTIAELDESPAVIENINLNPPELVNYPQGGKLTVRLWIDIEGSVVKVELVKSELPEEFVKSALANFLRTKFSPGLKGNVPVRSVAKIVVQYSAMD